MGEVKGLEKGGRAYKSQASHDTTTIRLTVAIGNHIKKGVKLTLVSESKISEGEFAKYKAHLESQRGYQLLTQNGAAKRRKDLVRTIKHNYTTEEIDAMIQRRSGYKTFVITTDEVAARKNLEYLMQKVRDGMGWAVLCCAVLCCAVLCCAVLCCAVLCCAGCAVL